jgi:hypothetical protein
MSRHEMELKGVKMSFLREDCSNVNKTQPPGS